MSNAQLAINPQILTWARTRVHRDLESLKKKFPKLAEWEKGIAQPTLNQLEAFARAVYLPIGYLFLPQPVEERIPVPDFRTLSDKSLNNPSPNLLDTIFLCQQRQEWYKEYVQLNKHKAIAFIGSATINDNPVAIASLMRRQLNLSMEERRKNSNWSDALRQLINQSEEAGVLIMASSVVGSNSHRKLSIEEFRGFAIADKWAPLIFINAADSKSAQMFTLAHELAHLFLGESGLVNSNAGSIPEQQIERWCNTVAAEFLMPLELLQQEYNRSEPIEEAIQRLSKIFKVSTLVSLRRLFDAGFISQDQLWQFYQSELKRIRQLEKNSGGGDFYRTLGARTGKRFARAVVSSTLEGQTLFQEAFRMLGIKKTKTFYNVASELKVYE